MDYTDEINMMLRQDYLINFLLEKNISEKARGHRKVKHKGTYNNGWQWDIEKLKSLTKQELYDICLICKG